jgi:hypothetical protein
MKLRLRGVGFAVALAFPLGGCLDAVVYPLNFEPTAYEDSLCQHGPPGGEIVNYGCVAGRALAPVRRHAHRHWRRIARTHS